MLDNKLASNHRLEKIEKIVKGRIIKEQELTVKFNVLGNRAHQDCISVSEFQGEKKTGAEEQARAMQTAIRIFTTVLRKEKYRQAFKTEYVGSTCAMTMVTKKHVVTVNVGDSYSTVLLKENKTPSKSKSKAKKPVTYNIEISPRHTLERSNIPGVFMREKDPHHLVGGLAMARSIGDDRSHHLDMPHSDHGDITIRPIHEHEEVLVLTASDGLEDYIEEDFGKETLSELIHHIDMCITPDELEKYLQTKDGRRNRDDIAYGLIHPRRITEDESILVVVADGHGHQPQKQEGEISGEIDIAAALVNVLPIITQELLFGVNGSTFKLESRFCKHAKELDHEAQKEFLRDVCELVDAYKTGEELFCKDACQYNFLNLNLSMDDRVEALCCLMELFPENNLDIIVRSKVLLIYPEIIYGKQYFNKIMQKLPENVRFKFLIGMAGFALEWMKKCMLEKSQIKKRVRKYIKTECIFTSREKALTEAIEKVRENQLSLPDMLKVLPNQDKAKFIVHLGKDFIEELINKEYEILSEIVNALDDEDKSIFILSDMVEIKLIEQHLLKLIELLPLAERMQFLLEPKILSILRGAIDWVSLVIRVLKLLGSDESKYSLLTNDRIIELSNKKPINIFQFKNLVESDLSNKCKYAIQSIGKNMAEIEIKNFREFCDFYPYLSDAERTELISRHGDNISENLPQPLVDYIQVDDEKIKEEIFLVISEYQRLRQISSFGLSDENKKQEINRRISVSLYGLFRRSEENIGKRIAEEDSPKVITLLRDKIFPN